MYNWNGEIAFQILLIPDDKVDEWLWPIKQKPLRRRRRREDKSEDADTECGEDPEQDSGPNDNAAAHQLDHVLLLSLLHLLRS